MQPGVGCWALVSWAPSLDRRPPVHRPGRPGHLIRHEAIFRLHRPPGSGAIPIVAAIAPCVKGEAPCPGLAALHASAFTVKRRRTYQRSRRVEGRCQSERIGTDIEIEVAIWNGLAAGHGAL